MNANVKHAPQTCNRGRSQRANNFGMNEALSEFWERLVIDKRPVYVENAELTITSVVADYTPEYLLNEGTPDWQETVIPRRELEAFIDKTGDNQWMRYRQGEDGEIQRIPCRMDAESYLAQLDKASLCNLVRDFIEHKSFKS